MHSVITEDDTGHMDMQRNKEEKRKKMILNKQCNTEENQVKWLHILRFSRILYNFYWAIADVDYLIKTNMLETLKMKDLS